MVLKVVSQADHHPQSHQFTILKPGHCPQCIMPRLPVVLGTQTIHLHYIPKVTPAATSTIQYVIYVHTVTPKTVLITNPKLGCEVPHNHLWELHLTLVRPN